MEKAHVKHVHRCAECEQVRNGYNLLVVQTFVFYILMSTKCTHKDRNTVCDSFTILTLWGHLFGPSFLRKLKLYICNKKNKKTKQKCLSLVGEVNRYESGYYILITRLL